VGLVLLKKGLSMQRNPTCGAQSGFLTGELCRISKKRGAEFLPSYPIHGILESTYQVITQIIDVKLKFSIYYFQSDIPGILSKNFNKNEFLPICSMSAYQHVD
jgi:hypothetical protein